VPASPATRDYQPGFAAALMAKDLGLAQEAVEQMGTASPIGAQALALFRQYLERGGGDKDFSGIINLIREGGVK
jgi:3-hydroxyisobutyrate dehydrogenase